MRERGRAGAAQQETGERRDGHGGGVNARVPAADQFRSQPEMSSSTTMSGLLVPDHAARAVTSSPNGRSRDEPPTRCQRPEALSTRNRPASGVPATSPRNGRHTESHRQDFAAAGLGPCVSGPRICSSGPGPVHDPNVGPRGRSFCLDGTAMGRPGKRGPSWVYVQRCRDRRLTPAG